MTGKHESRKLNGIKKVSVVQPAVSESSPAATSISFLVFLLSNALAAFYAPILDCDEAFNYWEPTHYLSRGFGLQTWEYSPEYAIRSWFYIGLHAAPALAPKLINWMTSIHLNEFYYTRFALAAACAYCQTCLLWAISRFVERRLAAIMALVMITTTGFFYASVAYLPSSFSMYAAMLGMMAYVGSAGKPTTTKMILWFGIGVIVGWPFSGALIIPLLLDEVAYMWLTWDVKGPASRIWRGVSQLLPFIASDVIVNAICFRRLVFSPWRIISYNMFSGSSRGPDIFGTEPWHFYIRNLLLNFNLWFVFALCTVPILALQSYLRLHSATKLSLGRSLVLSTPFYIWLAIFSVQPHKEERFMYPAYPFLCFNAASTVHILLHYLGHTDPRSLLGQIPGKLKAGIVATTVLFTCLVGVVRTLGTITAYHAPMDVYAPLQKPEYVNLRASVCLGKEWYRFPSSYFLPPKMRAHFLKSEFDGLLPGQFRENPANSLMPRPWIIPPGMNDQNLEDSAKHVNVSACHFLVDSQLSAMGESSNEPSYILDTATWEHLKCADFLDTSKTHALGRIFWLPDWTIVPQKLRRIWSKYCLLKRKSDSGSLSR